MDVEAAKLVGAGLTPLALLAGRGYRPNLAALINPLAATAAAGAITTTACVVCSG